jgi:hypothetical protein
MVRKNIAAVLDAFIAHRHAQCATARTDGETVYSYAMRIAWRDDVGQVHVVSEDDAPTKTTLTHVRACRERLLP